MHRKHARNAHETRTKRARNAHETRTKRARNAHETRTKRARNAHETRTETRTAHTEISFFCSHIRQETTVKDAAEVNQAVIFVENALSKFAALEKFVIELHAQSRRLVRFNYGFNGNWSSLSFIKYNHDTWWD